jgi:nitrogen fixation NifU-like protein
MEITSLKPVRIMPANFGPLRGANGNARITGPCGDTMEFWVRVKDGRVEHTTFTTDGCDHSMRCGSAAASLAIGKTLAEAATISQAGVLAAADIPDQSEHCGLLAANTLKAALATVRP